MLEKRIMSWFVEPTLALDADRPELRLFVYHIIYTLIFLSVTTMIWTIVFVGLGSVSESSSLAFVTGLFPIFISGILFFIHRKRWFRDLSVPISVLERRVLILGNFIVFVIVGSCALTAIDTGLYQTNPEKCLAISPIFTVLLTGSQKAAMFWAAFGACNQIMHGAFWQSGHKFDSAWVDPRPQYSFDVAASDAVLIYLFSLVIGLTTSAFVNETIRQTQQKSEYLRTALKRQHRFLAQTAHEIRTPLMHASSIIELLSEADEDCSISDLIVQKRELLPLLRRSTENVIILVSNVLDLEQIASRTLQLERISFDIQSLLAESARSILELNKQRDCSKAAASVEMAVLIDPEVPRMILGDPMRVRQVLFNLLDNACKFVPDLADHHQVVIISVRITTLSGNGKAILQFEVADNGIGMNSDKLSVIFTGFHFMENLFTTGMQLGLAAAQSLARHMGGDIRAASEGCGCGSRFIFTLEVEMNKSEIKAATAFPRIPGTVYFVSSCPSITAVLRPLLERAFTAIHVQNDLQLENKNPRVALVIANAQPETIVDMERIITESFRCPFLAIVDSSHFQHCSKLVADSACTVVIGKPIISNLFMDAIEQAIVTFGSRRTKSVTDENSAQVSQIHSEVEEKPLKLNNNLRILLVDDIPTNLKVVGRTLQSLGHTVDTAQNGLEALTLIEKSQIGPANISLPGSLDSKDSLSSQNITPFDLVITDIMMPVMDGVTLIKRIRERESNIGIFRLPMIALTAAATAQITDACLKAGADRILSKPFTKEILRDALETISNRRLL